MTADVCRICGVQGGEVFTAREMMFGLRTDFAYFQCPNCRCLQIRDIPKDMSVYYPDNYYSFRVKLPEPGTFGRLLWRLDGKMRLSAVNLGRGRRKRIFNWMRRTKAHYDSAILDVGCGRGKLLHELALFGFKDLTGADPLLDGEPPREPGIVLLKCELAEIDRVFDLIMMHHCFEHIAEQDEVLAAARERLRPNGFLLLRIPVADCHAWRQYGPNWFQLDAPRHLYLHTEKSVRMLADRAGFEVASIEWDSGPQQFWGSEQYARDVPHRSPSSYEENKTGSMFTKKQIRSFERMSRELNAQGQGDSACFYLCRR